jgi:hypothetical protein
VNMHKHRFDNTVLIFFSETTIFYPRQVYSTGLRSHSGIDEIHGSVCSFKGDVQYVK